MRPYICISHASADADAAQRFLRELTRYGFRYEAPDESVPRHSSCKIGAEIVGKDLYSIDVCCIIICCLTNS